MRRRDLWIRFATNDQRYLYSGVPLEIAGAFRHAFSKGTYFNRHIRDHYEATLIEDPNAAADAHRPSVGTPSPLWGGLGRGMKRAGSMPALFILA